eukprot:Sspe_Gene.58416::Locus_32032_Transcript_1_1_Confidence_1.000_Length_1850::g.58416::m.58416
MRAATPPAELLGGAAAGGNGAQRVKAKQQRVALLAQLKETAISLRDQIDPVVLASSRGSPTPPPARGRSTPRPPSRNSNAPSAPSPQPPPSVSPSPTARPADARKLKSPLPQVPSPLQAPVAPPFASAVHASGRPMRRAAAISTYAARRARADTYLPDEGSAPKAKRPKKEPPTPKKPQGLDLVAEIRKKDDKGLSEAQKQAIVDTLAKHGYGDKVNIPTLPEPILAAIWEAICNPNKSKRVRAMAKSRKEAKESDEEYEASSNEEGEEEESSQSTYRPPRRSSNTRGKAKATRATPQRSRKAAPPVEQDVPPAEPAEQQPPPPPPPPPPPAPEDSADLLIEWMVFLSNTLATPSLSNHAWHRHRKNFIDAARDTQTGLDQGESWKAFCDLAHSTKHLPNSPTPFSPKAFGLHLWQDLISRGGMTPQLFADMWRRFERESAAAN